jgi:NTE family protein
VFTEGLLKPAVAASMAVPGLVRPIEIDGRVLVDGGAVDPLPFGLLRGKADVVLAVDVSGGLAEGQGVPDPWESLFTTISVMSHTIVTEKLKSGAPDLVVRPNIGIFRMLDFFQASAILRAAEGAKAEVKEKLGALLAG